MGTWWRSEEMTYVSLIISEEVNPPVTIPQTEIGHPFSLRDVRSRGFPPTPNRRHQRASANSG